MRAAVAVGLLFFLAAQLIPGQLMKIFTGDADVIREGISYLRIVSFSYVFMVITSISVYHAKCGARGRCNGSLSLFTLM